MVPPAAKPAPPAERKDCRTAAGISIDRVMDANTLSIIGTMVGTGLALAVLMMRITARLDADRRAADARADADRRAHQASMDAFRVEMREIAERQARVEGPLDGRTGPAA